MDIAVFLSGCKNIKQPNFYTMGKDKYKLKNKQSYNKGLKERGSVCLWIETDVAEHWQHKSAERKRGAQKEYSDTAIEIC